MLELINDAPQNVVAVKAVKEVNKDDYNSVLLPALDTLSLQQEKLNLLILVEADVSNFSPGTWAEDVIVVLKNYSNWHRIAIVTDQEGVRNFAETFDKVIPGDFRGFSTAKIGEAKQWVSSN